MNKMNPASLEKMRRAEVFGIGSLIVKHRSSFPEAEHLRMGEIAAKLETALATCQSGLVATLQRALLDARVGWTYDDAKQHLMWWYPSGETTAQDATIDYFAITRDVSS